MIRFFILFTLIPINLDAQNKDYIKNKNDTLPEVKDLKEVVIYTTHVDKEVPITKSNLSKNELSQNNVGEDIPYLIQNIPSAIATSNTGIGIGYTGLRIRGVGNGNTNVTINGIPYTDSESMNTFWVDIPDIVSSGENIQIQRGIGSSTHGSGAFGASIHINTSSTTQNSFVKTEHTLGSFNTRKHNLSASTGIINDKFQVQARISSISSDGYIDRAKSDLFSYYLSSKFLFSKTTIHAIVFGGKQKTYQAWYGIDKNTLNTNRRYNPAGLYRDKNGLIQFYDNQIDNYRQHHGQLHISHAFSDIWKGKISLHYTKGKGYFEEYWQSASLLYFNLKPIKYKGYTVAISDIIARKWLDNDFYGSIISFQGKYNKSFWNIGGAFHNYDGDHFGRVIRVINLKTPFFQITPSYLYYFNKGKKQEANVFMKNKFKISNSFQLFTDIQYRYIKYYARGNAEGNRIINFGNTYNFFLPKIGMSYFTSKDNSYYLSYSYGQREPNRTDFENSHQNNPKSQQLHDVELGWRFRSLYHSFVVNTFFMRYKNQLVLTGKVDNNGYMIRTNSGNSFRLGLEIEHSSKLLSFLTIENSIGLSENKNIDFISFRNGKSINLGNTQISYSPRLIFYNQLVYNILKSVSVSLESKYVSSQFLNNEEFPNDESKIPEYFINNIKLRWTWSPKKLFNSIYLSAKVNNFLNKKYVSDGYFFTYHVNDITKGEARYFPQAGINFFISLGIKI